MYKALRVYAKTVWSVYLLIYIILYMLDATEYFLPLFPLASIVYFQYVYILRLYLRGEQ